MNTYTTCRTCGGLLHSTNNDTVHPLCDAKPTKVERLAAAYRQAVIDGDTALEHDLEQQIEAIDTKPPRLLDAALLYASWGWPVFPLKAKAKTPATKHGFKDATTEPDRIRAWWERNPDSNIGLPTGLAFDVIDVDVPIGAMTYHRMLQQGFIPDSHGQVATSRGGLHLYVPPSGDGNKAGIQSGVDYRGAGGYVVAPPSTLGPCGRGWSWIHKPSPAIIEALRVAA